MKVRQPRAFTNCLTSAVAAVGASRKGIKGDNMILGMSTSTFTAFHVVLSLIGIVAGLLALYGLLQGKLFAGWTHLFLLTTVLTSLTGYLFPVQHVMPSHIVGAISLLALAIAMVGLYGRQLAGGWRRVYVISATIALYLNCFVLVVQAFEKVPALHALAPNGNEAPFLIAQIVLLAAFVWAGIKAVKNFRADPVQVVRERRAA
jgi:hypothetical protein